MYFCARPPARWCASRSQFRRMVIFLRVPSVDKWKYVDDTSITEFFPQCSQGDIQSTVSAVEDWSGENARN